MLFKKIKKINIKRYQKYTKCKTYIKHFKKCKKCRTCNKCHKYIKTVEATESRTRIPSFTASAEGQKFQPVVQISKQLPQSFGPDRSRLLISTEVEGFRGSHPPTPRIAPKKNAYIH